MCRAQTGVPCPHRCPPDEPTPPDRLSHLQDTAQYCHPTGVLSPPPRTCRTGGSDWCSFSARGCQQQHKVSFPHTHQSQAFFGGHLILNTQTAHFLCSHRYRLKSTKDQAWDGEFAGERGVCPHSQAQQQLSTMANSSYFCHASQVLKTSFWGRKAITASPAHETESKATAAVGRGQYRVTVFPSHLHRLQRRGQGLLVQLTCPLLRACSDLKLSQKKTKYPNFSASHMLICRQGWALAGRACHQSEKPGELLQFADLLACLAAHLTFSVSLSPLVLCSFSQFKFKLCSTETAWEVFAGTTASGASSAFLSLAIPELEGVG